MTKTDKFFIYGLLLALLFGTVFAYATQQDKDKFFSLFDTGKYDDNFNWLNQR